MTSLDLFPAKENIPKVPPEWGTGRHKERANLWTPKAPTWHFTGEQADHNYTLTDLKLSHVRSTDQLLPNPEHSEMQKLLYNREFPAEHPYSSHIPRFAIFPKFDSPADPKRGVAARRQIPKNPEMPSNAYDVIVVSKTKGSGVRRELQALPPESQKQPLVWHDHPFDQKVKSASGERQLYYPVPPKTFVPNLELRDDADCIRGNMVVSSRTANVMRNLERQQWKSTYDLNHTGSGPSNPLNLDNLEEKHYKRITTGEEDDELYPHFLSTFDPSRPAEGRIGLECTPRAQPQTDQWPDPETDPAFQRKMTLTEREEDRLLNGTHYVNLPTPRFESDKPEGAAEMVNIIPHHSDKTMVNNGTPPTPKDTNVDTLSRQKMESIQQMEANNRWQVLESQTPKDDLCALQQKMELASQKTKPQVFYQHEGQFQRERAGMYKTSYDPYLLQQAMNGEETRGSNVMDTSSSHVDALNFPVPLNQEMADAIRYNRTLGGPPGSVPQLSSQASQYEAIQPLNEEKRKQKSALQPNIRTSDVHTQEGVNILRDDTYGEEFNTKTFLQENELPLHCRNEPLLLMSHENKDLNKLRNIARAKMARVTTDPFELSRKLSDAPALHRPCTAPEVGGPPGFSSSYRGKVQDLALSRATVPQSIHLPVPLQKDRANKKVSQKYRMSVSDQFTSNASNVTGPSDLSRSWTCRSSYQAHHPAKRIDLSYKVDNRFNWTPGCGRPRPQSCLNEIQDSFDKTSVKRRLHAMFPECSPDLRENITAGKKHTFCGINAQVLRGAPLLA